MSAVWKTVRVFISSTFRDMQAERDHLVRFVFPRLRQQLLPRRIHLVDVDLRWGVTSDDNVTEVCREVVKDCRPRFLCILGGRYGHVPKNAEKSITADEIDYGVFNPPPDDAPPNDKGPVRAFFYFRKDEVTNAIPDEDARAGAYREFPLAAEIGDFGPGEAARRAGERVEKLANLKAEIERRGLPVRRYHAEWNATTRRLTALEKFGESVFDDLFLSIKTDSKLAVRFNDEADAARTVAGDEQTFAEEADQMGAFIEERTERFVIGSREPLLRDMLAFASADAAPNIFVLTGDPGSGKSALLAKFCRLLAEGSSNLASSSPSLLVSHFIGASTGSTDLRRTLRRLCHELAKAAGNTEPRPLDIKDLVTHFQKLLAEAAGRWRVILVFDALNQFDGTDGAHSLNWLPRELPRDVRIVVSVLAPVDGQPEHQTLAILRHRPGTRMEKLELLTEADALAIIEGSLRRYAKRLSPEQLAALLAKPAGRIPLYVLTALEELRTLGTYEEITDRIQTLPGDARALFGWILTERLARDPGFRDREGRPCGAALVGRFAACLGVSRHGLSPAELTALVDPGDPLGNVAALLRLLRPYLMRRGELLDFYHSQIREAVLRKCLPENPNSLHADIANYLEDRWRVPDVHALSELPYHQTKSGQWELLSGSLGNLAFAEAKCTHGLAYPLMEDYNDALSECPTDHAARHNLEAFQLFYAANVHLLAEAPTLTRQQAANADDGTPPAQAAAESPPSGPWLRWVNKCIEFSQHVRVLDGRGGEITALAFSPTGDRLITAAADGTVRLWDVRLGQPGWTFVLSNGSAKELVYHPRDNVLAVAGTDAALHLLSSLSGLEHAVVRSDHYWVERCQFVEDGSGIVTFEISHGDRTGHGGKQYVYLRDKSDGSVKKLLLTRDCDKDFGAFFHLSNTLVAAVADNQFHCWKASTGEELRPPTTQKCELAAISPDESFVALTHCQFEASKSPDGPQNITIFEVSSGQATRELRTEGRVAALSFSPDGARLFYVTHTGCLRIFEIETGKLLAQGELGRNAFANATCIAVHGWIAWQESPLEEPVLVDALTLRRVPLASIIGKRPTMLRFAANGELLAVGADHGMVSLVPSAILRASHDRPPQPHTRRRLAWDDGRVCLIDHGTPESQPILDPLSNDEARSEHSHAWQIVDGHLSNDGQRFLNGGQMLNTVTGDSTDCAEIEHGVKCLLPPAGTIALVRRGYPSQELALCEPIRGKLRPVLRDADSRFQFSAGSDWSGAWNPAEVHGENFLEYALSPNGRDLACGGMVTVVLLDLLTAVPHWMFRIERPNMRGVEFSPDGSALLIIRDSVLQMHASVDGRRIWQRPAKAYTPEVRPHRAIGRIVPAFLDEKPPFKRWEQAIFSQDGRLLAAVAEGGMIAVFSCESGEMCWEVEHDISPKRARFAPSGDFLLLLWDDRLEIRSAHDGAIVARLSQRSGISDAVWTPTGAGLAIRSSLGTEGEKLLLYSLENVGVGPRILTGRLWEFTTVSEGRWSPTPIVRCAACGHHQPAIEPSGESSSFLCVACGMSCIVMLSPAAVQITDPLVQSRRGVSIEEIRESAQVSLRKGYWAAAETHLQELLTLGEPLAELAPQIVACLLNAHEDLLPHDVAKIDDLIRRLESDGHTALAADLRGQLEAKHPKRKKPWWKMW